MTPAELAAPPSFGIRFDGLLHVNGQWRIFPSPWAVLSVGEPGHHH